MNKTMHTLILFLLFSVLLSTPISAHPGRTDANGGHYNRATGEYHYHDGKSNSGSSGSNSNSEDLPPVVTPETDSNISNDTKDTEKYEFNFPELETSDVPEFPKYESYHSEPISSDTDKPFLDWPDALFFAILAGILFSTFLGPIISAIIAEFTWYDPSPWFVLVVTAVTIALVAFIFFYFSLCI